MIESSKYFLENPPRCTDKFSAKPIELKDVVFDGHGEDINPVFGLSCECQSAAFKVLGYLWENPDSGETIFVGPLALSCEGCCKVTELFDIKMHGYDAELGHGCYSVRGGGEPLNFNCPNCGLSDSNEI